MYHDLRQRSFRNLRLLVANILLLRSDRTVHEEDRRIESSAAATTTYTWSGQKAGFLQSIQQPNGASESFTYYTPSGQVATHVDWNSKSTNYSYADSGTWDG